VAHVRAGRRTRFGGSGSRVRLWSKWAGRRQPVAGVFVLGAPPTFVEAVKNWEGENKTGGLFWSKRRIEHGGVKSQTKTGRKIDSSRGVKSVRIQRPGNRQKKPKGRMVQAISDRKNKDSYATCFSAKKKESTETKLRYTRKLHTSGAHPNERRGHVQKAKKRV